MRDFELRLPQDGCAKQDEIEIQRPRGVWKWTFTSRRLLDLLKRVEELVNVQPGVAHHRRIQERRLNAGNPNGLGFQHCGHAEVIEKPGEVLMSEAHVSLTIAEI